MDLFLGFVLGVTVTIALCALITILAVRKIDKLNEELNDLKKLDEEDK